MTSAPAEATASSTKAPSPFLPGTSLQYAWDSTSLGLLKECPRKYQFTIIEGWRRRGLESPHLAFGTIYHSALETYDKHRAVGDDHEIALRAALRHTLAKSWDWADRVIEHSAKNRETLARSVVWYLEEFAEDSAETVKLADGRPAVELSFRFDSGLDIRYGAPACETLDEPTSYLLCGHLDRLVTFQSRTYVLDRKTSSAALDQKFFAGFSPDNQMSLYTIAGQVLFGTGPIAGVIIDGAQVAVGFTRFARGFTYRTEAQNEEWLADLESWLRLAEGYAAAEHWPMNEKSCGNYGGCPFRGICSRDPRVRQPLLESDYERKRWNPLEVR